MNRLLTNLVVIATMAICGAAYSATQASFTYLETYDQLVNHIGQSGYYFVRDAGNTKTGQNGDPSVVKGWALYVWDAKSASTGWIKIAEQESLDASFNERLLANYFTKYQVNTLLENLRADMPDTAALNARINNLDVVTAGHSANIVNIGGQIQALQTEDLRLNERIDNISNAGSVPPSVTNDIESLNTRVEAIEQSMNATAARINSIDIGAQDDITVNKLYDTVAELLDANTSSNTRLMQSGRSSILPISVKSGSMNVVSCNKDVGSNAKIVFCPDNGCNFEVIIPASDKLKSMLPLTVVFNTPNGTVFAKNAMYNAGATITRLPVMIRAVEQGSNMPVMVMAQYLMD